MVKKAYQKLCFYPLVRIAVFGVLLSALLYHFHGFLSAGDELVARVLGWLCLGCGALHGSLLTVGVTAMSFRSSGQAAVCAAFRVMCGSA